MYSFHDQNICLMARIIIKPVASEAFLLGKKLLMGALLTSTIPTASLPGFQMLVC